jgi:hypothetical protein
VLEGAREILPGQRDDALIALMGFPTLQRQQQPAVLAETDLIA